MSFVTTGKMFIETEHRASGETVSMDYEEKQLEVKIMSNKQTPEVFGKIGLTLSLGSYEFVRIDAGVTLPCEKKDIKEAYEEAFSLASAEVFKRAEEAKNTIK